MIESKLKTLVILFALLSSLLVFPTINMLPAVKATYVEGVIDKDTVWTLLDSPFIVCQNVTIKEDVTLTIEPGVEVRFGGGPFTIIVNGRLLAKGTEEKSIKFTSNREDPTPGDWATLIFNGANQPTSVLENCVVEYGTNGITINGGTVVVRRSVIQFNNQNGILVLNGSVHIEQNILQNNSGGVMVSGGNATIQNNDLTLNGDGIILDGNLTSSNVAITRNHVFANDNSGISLAMESGGDIAIRNNTVALNHYGFYISTNASMSITRNYIHSNIVGVFCEQGSHTIRFNDIYNNTIGMDASPNARVNATQNFWGDRSGPYHESLNPRGKGNKVGGNGVNIDFIFFLTAPIDHKNSLPTAVLWTDKTTVALGEKVAFVGSGSHDADGRIDQYFFNFGDGQNSGWTTLSMFFYTYNSPGLYTVSLQVMDDFGNTSSPTSSTVHVVDGLSPLEVSITLTNDTVDYNTPVTATVNVSFNGTPVDSANVNLFAVARGYFANLTSSTDSSGSCTITFAAPNVTDITYVRVMVKASKAGYADGSAHEYLRVLPPLNVNVTAENVKVYSQETVAVTVKVTNAYEEPVANVSLRAWAGNQTIWEGFTNDKGMASFNFTVPLVYAPLNLTVQVEAVKELYARSFGACLIEVYPRELAVVIYPELSEIRSEEFTKIFVYVYWRGVPVPEAQVSLALNSSDYAVLSSHFGVTDSNGLMEITLTAMQITTNITVMVNATAIKEGYISGENWTYVHVRPKILTVHVTVSRELLITDEEVKVNAHVECEGVPVANANVTLYLNISSFAPLTAFTNAEGNVTFALNAAVPQDMMVNMTVKAQKEGYVEGYCTLVLEAKPANMTVEVSIYSTMVRPGEYATIYVYVKHGDQPVKNATVTVTASLGSIAPVTTYTNEAGYCEVPIYIPSTTGPSDIYVSVNVTKYGYNSVEKPDCVYFQVVVEAAFPWFTLLLVLIPVALLVVFVVLVKLGVIVVSFGGEEEAE
ncbi:MAG: PKD domain-containing protein [Candidatus Bathyarchaeia archaeon]